MTGNGTTDDQGDWGRTELDAQEEADAARFLDDPSAGDDEPWSPPDRLPRGAELIGVETDGGETLDQRMRQEVPEDESVDPGTIGGDDPDAIPADRDVLGGEAGTDTAFDGDGDGPEASAMRVVEDEAT